MSLFAYYKVSSFTDLHKRKKNKVRTWLAVCFPPEGGSWSLSWYIKSYTNLNPDVCGDTDWNLTKGLRTEGTICAKTTGEEIESVTLQPHSHLDSKVQPMYEKMSDIISTLSFHTAEFENKWCHKSVFKRAKWGALFFGGELDGSDGDWAPYFGRNCGTFSEIVCCFALKGLLPALISKSNHFSSKGSGTCCFRTLGIKLRVLHFPFKLSCQCFHLLNDRMWQTVPLARVLPKKKVLTRPGHWNAQYRCSRTSWLCKTQGFGLRLQSFAAFWIP